MSVEIPQYDDRSRDLDPNVLQRRAAIPDDSIWVNASAGTGKTKVLTDRILRLLMPREDGRHGTKPHKILGLTFTKAGANEMDIRISKILGQWAISADDDLRETLKTLLGRDPKPDEMHAARRLFADVIDTPGRLKIMTIHAFCQSVLTRFPLEAGLTPGFAVAEEREAGEILLQAKKQSLQHIYNDKTSPLFHALSDISAVLNEEQFLALLTSLSRERKQLKSLMDRHFGVDGLYTALCGAMGVKAGHTAQDILFDACADDGIDRATLKEAADALLSGGKTDQGIGQKIADWLASDPQQRVKTFHLYQAAYMTQKGEVRAKLMGKALAEKLPHLLDAMSREATWIMDVLDRCKAAQSAALTRDFLMLGDDILTRYDALKETRNVLDYEDLIFRTLDLLNKNSAWVQFKLDQGIDHILIDEAQDTNPEQWQIIEALCHEFFAGEGAHDDTRTVFTVGDEKQSIYSFQRASPEEFERMQNHFAQKVQDAKQSWNRVDLNISFRSLQCVLDVVDRVFAAEETRKGLGIHDIKHHAFRRGQAGLITLWPLCKSDDDIPGETWEPPVSVTDQKGGATKLSDKIAKTIRGWLDDGEELPSHGRTIQPGDIMILVRTRNAFVHQLIRALKLHDIPVGGLDRIVLSDQLAVQDLLAAAEFALYPKDDLTLACLLKSPLIGMDEDTLYALSHDRKSALIEAVNASSDHQAVADYLRMLRHNARHLAPYAFFAAVLHMPCPADSLSGLRAFKARLGIDALDALDEFLNSALTFERDHTHSVQDFLKWQASGQGDIKRDAGEAAQHVRIMTVHGSKGLQAPIVFLPDTVGVPGTGAPKADSRFLWPSQSGLDLPLWSPRADLETTLYAQGKATVQARLEEEYRRLLYVAMTRAEDRLYIGGYLGKKPAADQCWYHLCARGIQSLEGVEECEDGTLRYSAPQTKDADRKSDGDAAHADDVHLPDWVFRPAPAEPHPPKPLTPSRPSESEPSALSPLQSDDGYRFRRGNLTHTLLQFLPDIPAGSREVAGKQYLAKNGADIGDDILESILHETLRILDDASFAPIFGAGSRAEVPVSGLLPDGRLISGQIDRLLVTDDEIMIVDYKTNRPPPSDPSDIPLVYYNQMKAYADTLSAIYPGRSISCALLWTDGPRLMPLDP